MQRGVLPADAASAPSGRARRLAVLDAVTSLWSPVLVFLASFTLYVATVQLWPVAEAWALPAIRAVSLASLAGLLLLLIARALASAPFAAREARIEARETVVEVRGVAHSRPELLEEARALESAIPVASADELRARTAELVRRTEAAQLGHRLGRVVAGMFAKAFLVALLIRGALVEPYRIPTGSMLPTLQIGDQVLVNRFVYGVQVPFTQWVPFPFVRRPARGDVIVFNEPQDNEVFIKRVVGLPGEEIALIDGVLHVDGVPQPQQELGQGSALFEQREEGWTEVRGTRVEETLGGRAHAQLRRVSPPRQRTEGPWKIPGGQVFVLGDDRDASADSRYGFGKRRGVSFVPYGNIKGKAMVIWLSLSYDGILSNLFGGTGLRADRMFLPVR